LQLDELPDIAGQLADQQAHGDVSQADGNGHRDRQSEDDYEECGQDDILARGIAKALPDCGVI
jgi:hypothetical protein